MRAQGSALESGAQERMIATQPEWDLAENKRGENRRKGGKASEGKQRAVPNRFYINRLGGVIACSLTWF